MKKIDLKITLALICGLIFGSVGLCHADYMGAYTGTMPPIDISNGYDNYAVFDFGGGNIQYFFYNGDISYGVSPAMPPFQPESVPYMSIPAVYTFAYYDSGHWNSSIGNYAYTNPLSQSTVYSNQSYVFPNSTPAAPAATLLPLVPEESVAAVIIRIIQWCVALLGIVAFIAAIKLGFKLIKKAFPNAY